MDELTAGMIAQIHDIEQKDDSQIIAELAGETIEEYVYEIWRKNPKTKQKERKVKLSWVGTREVARSRGNIILDPPIITETDTALRFVIRATDLKRNFTVFGGCHQPKMMKVNDVEVTGEITGHHYEEDDFAFQKGLSKSQRNALTLCIPGEYAARMMDRFLRASGKTPLITQGPKASTGKGDKQETPTKAPVKPRAEWDNVTEAEVPDYLHLEPLIWKLCKLQPHDIYVELGGGTRNDMTIPAWQAFLTLKDRFAPLEPTG